MCVTAITCMIMSMCVAVVICMIMSMCVIVVICMIMIVCVAVSTCMIMSMCVAMIFCMTVGMCVTTIIPVQMHFPAFLRHTVYTHIYVFCANAIFFCLFYYKMISCQMQLFQFPQKLLFINSQIQQSAKRHIPADSGCTVKI